VSQGLPKVVVVVVVTVVHSIVEVTVVPLYVVVNVNVVTVVAVVVVVVLECVSFGPRRVIFRRTCAPSIPSVSLVQFSP